MALSALQFKFLEKLVVEQGKLEQLGRRHTASLRSRAPERRAPTPRGVPSSRRPGPHPTAHPETTHPSRQRTPRAPKGPCPHTCCVLVRPRRVQAVLPADRAYRAAMSDPPLTLWLASQRGRRDADFKRMAPPRLAHEPPLAPPAPPSTMDAGAAELKSSSASTT
jgi:hypothetical protein